MAHAEKVVIIGLEGASSSLVFDRWWDDLPNLNRLAAGGLHGELGSSLPPGMIPSWSCLAASKDPGTLGIYGTHARRDWSYEIPGAVSNLEMRQPRLWDHVARAGKTSILLGVPQTFPMVKAPRGCLVTGPLTPGPDSPHAYPPELADEIADLVGTFRFDVSPRGDRRRADWLDEVRDVDEQRFKVARHLLTTRSWDLFWMVAPGLAHVQRVLWNLMDPAHPHYEPDDPLADAIHDYYVFLDDKLGELLALFDLENTGVWVVSACGAKRLDGGFCLNEWLLREGLLTVKRPVDKPCAFDLANVDWSRTKVWSSGGPCGLCFINRKEREPRGIVGRAAGEALRDELISRLEGLRDPGGRAMGNRAYKPDEHYCSAHGVPPDLLVVFGDHHWCCVDSLGHAGVFVLDEAAVPDAAADACEGLYVLSHPALPSRRRDVTLFDVVPTTLEMMGLPIPRGLQGRSLLMG